MVNYSREIIRRWSIISGISLLIMTLAAAFAYGYVFSSFYVTGQPETTMNNILNNPTLYYLGAFAWCLILITDLLVAYGFYVFLTTAKRTLAITSGLLRLIYSVSLAVGIFYLFAKNTGLFLKFWSLGLFIIGFHLAITGIAVFFTANVPKILAILLLIAGTGYSLIHGLENFIPEGQMLAQTLEKILAAPMTIGELSFGLWLLFKGGKSTTLRHSDDPIQLSS